jgi:hypothetical protein
VATRYTLDKTGLPVDDIGTAEINEARPPNSRQPNGCNSLRLRRV